MGKFGIARMSKTCMLFLMVLSSMVCCQFAYADVLPLDNQESVADGSQFHHNAGFGNSDAGGSLLDLRSIPKGVDSITVIGDAIDSSDITVEADRDNGTSDVVGSSSTEEGIIQDAENRADSQNSEAYDQKIPSVNDAQAQHFDDSSAEMPGDTASISVMQGLYASTASDISNTFAENSTGGVVYYDSNGNQVIDSEVYVPNGDDTHPAGWYYFDKEGVMVTGWYLIAKQNKTVYYSPDGSMVHGSYKLASALASPDHPSGYYWFDLNTGEAAFSKEVFNSIDMLGDGWRCYGPNGVVANGEVYRNTADGWFFYDEETFLKQFGWRYLDAGSKWVYYAASDGKMAHGEAYIDNAWYLFNEYTGATMYDWVYLSNGDKWVFYGPNLGDGRMRHGEAYVDGTGEHGWCYFDKKTGSTNYEWKYLTDGHKWVYYDPWTGRMWHKSALIWGVYRDIDPITGAVDVSASRELVAAGMACEIAADDSHGYDQAYRWGERGDYDCSSLVITVFGMRGAGATYTGNMRPVFTRNGFVWMTDLSRLQAGDILLNEIYHTAIYLGNNWIVQASGNELNHGAIGGKPGDQTGEEIWETNYNSNPTHPWDGFLRYIG